MANSFQDTLGSIATLGSTTDARRQRGRPSLRRNGCRRPAHRPRRTSGSCSTGASPIRRTADGVSAAPPSGSFQAIPAAAVPLPVARALGLAERAAGWTPTLAEPVLGHQRRRAGLGRHGRLAGASAGGSTPSVCASSPDSYISVTMSQPPTSSPLHEQLRDRRPVRERRQLLADARVGQDVDRRVRRAERLERRRPCARRSRTSGRSGVPFMKRMTS